MGAKESALFDHYFYTGRVKFNEARFLDAHKAFERMLPQAEGLQERLICALVHLSVGFELIHSQRMIDPGYLQLHDAADHLAQIPLTHHMGIDLRSLKQSLAEWITHLEELGTRPGLRPVAPRLPEI